MRCVLTLCLHNALLSFGDKVRHPGLAILKRKGFTGKDVRVGVFDTGVKKEHAVFQRLDESTGPIHFCHGYTSQATCDDGFGHGTFVASIIAGRNDFRCPGMAEDTELYIFKVFTDDQESQTSWMLEASNEALALGGLDVVSLSVGGNDFYDYPYIDKVHELTAAGITVVAAAGNDGQFGTILNPADQTDVIGVGGYRMDYRMRTMNQFSARGMTTVELPLGVGRPKPDVLAHGHIYAADSTGECKFLSGTSVAAPVITGLLALLLQQIKQQHPSLSHNPALIKQMLLESTDSLPHPCSLGTDPRAMGKSSFLKREQRALCYKMARVFDAIPSSFQVPLLPRGLEGNEPSFFPESYNDKIVDLTLQSSFFVQGGGVPNLERASRMIEKSKIDSGFGPHVSLFPPEMDLVNDALKWWPLSDTPLFHTSAPLCVNLTILNSVSAVGYLKSQNVTFFESDSSDVTLSSLVKTGKSAALDTISASRLSVWFPFPENQIIWPWSGSFCVCFSSALDVERPTTVAGLVEVAVTVFPDLDEPQTYPVVFPFMVRVVPRPPKTKRLLWDMHHQISYPPSFSPVDNLRVTNEPFDWHGDSPFINFRHAFNVLRRAGYSVEIWNNLNSAMGDTKHRDGLDLSLYGALLIIDPERNFSRSETNKIVRSIRNYGLGLLIVSEWFDLMIQDQLWSRADSFSNSRWKPATGGSNVPALNSLLEPFGVELGGEVYHGELTFTPNTTAIYVGSTGCIRRLPARSVACQSIGRMARVSGYEPFNKVYDRWDKNEKEDHHPTLLGLVDTAQTQLLAVGSQKKRNSSMGGRIAVFTDSGCLDGSNNPAQSNGSAEYCFSLLLTLVAYVADRNIAPHEAVGELTEAPRCYALAHDSENLTPSGVNHLSKLEQSIAANIDSDDDVNQYLRSIVRHFPPAMAIIQQPLQPKQTRLLREKNPKALSSDIIDDSLLPACLYGAMRMNTDRQRVPCRPDILLGSHTELMKAEAPALLREHERKGRIILGCLSFSIGLIVAIKMAMLQKQRRCKENRFSVYFSFYLYHRRACAQLITFCFVLKKRQK